MQKNIKTTKSELLVAFDKSQTKTIVDVCRITGVTRGTFYFHFYKDEGFRKQILTKKAERLIKLAAA